MLPALFSRKTNLLSVYSRIQGGSYEEWPDVERDVTVCILADM